MPHPESPDGTPAHTKQADWRQPAIIAGFGPRDKVQTGGNGDNRESPLPFSVISVSSCSKIRLCHGMGLAAGAGDAILNATGRNH